MPNTGLCELLLMHFKVMLAEHSDLRQQAMEMATGAMEIIIEPPSTITVTFANQFIEFSDWSSVMFS